MGYQIRIDIQRHFPGEIARRTAKHVPEPPSENRAYSLRGRKSQSHSVLSLPCLLGSRLTQFDSNPKNADSFRQSRLHGAAHGRFKPHLPTPIGVFGFPSHTLFFARRRKKALMSVSLGCLDCLSINRPPGASERTITPESNRDRNSACFHLTQPCAALPLSLYFMFAFEAVSPKAQFRQRGSAGRATHS